MKKIKVFISSVIENYKDHSDAVEESITELNRDQGLNFEVIRIDPKKYPAMNKSPQKACLDGVRECDIYLGIYPRDKYGWEGSPVGISPTHEEFRQAVKDNKCRLVFVENTKKKNRRQKKFLEEVGEYTKGRFWNEFESGNIIQLKHMVYRTLSSLIKTNFEECLPDYLKVLLQRYKRIIRPWDEEAGSLPISEIVQLELREEEHKEENQSQNEYSKVDRNYGKLSKTLLFFDVIKENQRLLILGDPGTGKSTSLQWVTYFCAEQISSYQKELLVPIYLELKWYKNNLLELITTCFGENGIVFDEETVESWIKKGKFLFIFDGFDEVTEPSTCLRDIKQLLSLSGESRFVVASRKIEHLKDFQSLEFKKAEVKQLSDSQIELFIGKYLGKDKGSRLLKELKGHNLLNEARNPLILWLMTLEFREKSQISINKGMLFKNVIEQHFLKKWESKVIPAKDDIQKYVDLKIQILSQLAFYTIDEEKSIKMKEDKAKEIIDNFLKDGRTGYKDLRDEILRQLLASHLLMRSGSQISFWNKSFRDYFAALELKIIFLNNPRRFIKRYVTKKWEESILFLVGILENSSDLVAHLIKPFWYYFLRRFPFQLSLAAKCIGANNGVRIELQQKVTLLSTEIIQHFEIGDKPKKPITNLKSFFFPILFDAEEAFQALGEMKSEKAIELLSNYLENHECNAPLGISGNHPCYLCQLAVEALRNVPLMEKIQNSLLFTAIWHKDGIVRNIAKDILRENMTKEIASRLVEVMLNKNNKDVVHRGVYRESPGLVIEEYSVRRCAIDIICGYHGDELKYPKIIIGPLIHIALEDESEDLRTHAMCTLGAGHPKPEYYEKKIIDKLSSNLYNKKCDLLIRINAARALIYHFSPKVRRAFIQALDDENAEVKKRAAHGLLYVGITTRAEEDEASKKLLKLFDNEDIDVRINAIKTYGCIRRNPVDKEISRLINLLKDENILIKGLVAEALGRLHAKNALRALKQMVEDEKYVYPWSYAIWAILQIEPSFSEVIKKKGWEIQYNMQLDDDDIDKRRRAAEVLRRIGTEISLPFLKKIYENVIKRRDISGELFYAIHEIEDRIKRSNT